MPDAQDAPRAARPTPLAPWVARGSDGGWGRRTARRHRRVTVLSVLVVGLLLVAAAAVGAGLLGEQDDEVAEPLCSGGPTVEVVVDPTLAPTLERVAAEEGRHLLSTGVCADLDVIARDSADAAALLAAAEDPSGLPQVWVPDSSVWLGRAVPETPETPESPAPGAAGLVTLARLGSLVSTPLVMATSPEAVTGEGWAETPPTWQAALGSGRGLALPELSGSAVGLQSLVALRTSVTDPDAARAALTTAALAVGRGQVADPAAAMALVTAGGAEAPLAPTTEQQVFVANRGDGTPAVVGVQPSDATTSLDYPLVRVDTPDSEAGVDAAAIEGVLRLLEDEGRAAAVVDGFRAPLRAATDASPGPTAPATQPSEPASAPSSPQPSPRPSEAASAAVPSEPPPAPSAAPAEPGRPVVPVPTAADVDVLLGQLTELSRPSRLLAVVDASASMRGVTETGATRARIAQDASTRTLAMFPDSAAVGLWFFAIGMGDGTDHDEVVPIAPLDPASGDQREQLVEGIATLPDRLTPGGTGLYDTTLAAVRAVHEQYDPEASNSVVLITDGREEDPSGISRDELLATLQAEADPERPVRVIAIGISDDVDAEELTAIAEATGGAAYLAERPEDFEAVLLDALARR